jgi:RNA polymerase sigma factor (sigma-70 family)
MTAPPPKDLEQLLAWEPFVRGLARALVADDADEVVQQTWLQALDSRGTVREPRSWLARVVHNAARNLRRSRRRQQQRERAAAVCERLPSSAELLLREERRRELVLAVDALPAPLRTVVLLRWFEDLPPRRIAAELGLPVATVWNQLRRALQLLRERLDAEHGGDRRAWLLPLVPVAALGPRITGCLLMATKAKALAAAAVALVLAVAWSLRPAGGGGATAVAAMGVQPASAQPAVVPAAVADAAPLQRTPIVAEPNLAGALVVHVQLADGAPAADRVLLFCRDGVSGRSGSRRVVSDAGGELRLDGLAQGAFWVSDPMTMASVRAEVVAGAEREATLAIRDGLRVNGIVVDERGAPVAGALIDCTPAAAMVDATSVAAADARGEFSLRGCKENCLIGARAPGRASSLLQLLMSRRDATERVRIELLQPGGQVEGVVVDRDGRPVANAWVCVGGGAFREIDGGGARLPAVVRGDATGRFTAIGLVPGVQPVRVRAAGAAPWRGICDVIAGVTTSLRIALQPEVVCTGIVRGNDGTPVAGARVESGADRDFDATTVRSAADGSYRLAGLMPGESIVTARGERGGRARLAVRAAAGEVVRCDLQLEFGVDVRGRVLDENGTPLRASLLFLADASPGAPAWGGRTSSSDDGRFDLGDVPSGRRLTAQVTGEFVALTQLRDLDPAAGELVLRVSRAPPPSAHLTGRVVAPDGRPVANAMVLFIADEGSFAVTDARGAFDLAGVRPGRRAVLVMHRDHPELRSGERDVAAHSTCDFGELQFVAGGTARVVGSKGLTADDCQILDVGGRSAGHDTASGLRADSLQSEILAPGSYTLRVRRQGREQSIPFTITAGTETRVDVPAK